MTYEPGRMGIAEGLALAFVLTIPRIFLTAPANQIDIAAGLAWLMPLASGLGAFVGFCLLIFVLSRIPGSDLVGAAYHLLGRVGGLLVGLFYAGYFFLDAVLLLRQFAENTLLTALPFLEFRIAIGIYALVAGILAYIGVEGFARTTYLLLPFGIIPLLGVLTLLFPFYNIYHLLPWQGSGLGVVVPKALMDAGYNTGVLVLIILAKPLQNLRTVKAAALYGLGGSAALKALSTFSFTLVLGYTTGREKVLPFYEMARLVYLSRYVQRIEALFILLWVMYGMLAIAANLFIGLYLLVRLLGLPALRPLIPVATLVIAFLAMIPGDITDTINLDILFVQTYAAAAVYVVPGLLFAASWWQGRRKEVKGCVG
ncbi:Spore germination protein [Thermosinus carboxydivorans Nor1]|uniref:Spore germination protein n=1 Tax=Thermosinus carboxydivorans Nor1 TaxID=401526 RepID=A1HTL3_9FIRM|nr:GerAB/ArcD/ProY family transporter [Thermosinus carboxydivorans]EAX46626.1 Spore germination protein [Thermosinus carboxydivorans Nor1]